MALFVAIVASAWLGSSVVLIQFIVGPSLVLQLAGNAVFFLGVAVAAALRDRDLLNSPRALVLAPVGFIAFTVLAGLAGLALFERSRAAALLLMAPWALGYTPSAGPDAPLGSRLPFWILSIFALIAAGLAAGAWFRRYRGASRSDGDSEEAT